MYEPYMTKHPQGKLLHFEWEMTIHGKTLALAFCRLILLINKAMIFRERFAIAMIRRKRFAMSKKL